MDMSIDFSTVVPASNCPHYISRVEQEGGARACVGCSLKLVRVFSRLGISGPIPAQRQPDPDRWITSAGTKEEAA